MKYLEYTDNSTKHAEKCEQFIMLNKFINVTLLINKNDCLLNP